MGQQRSMQWVSSKGKRVESPEKHNPRFNRCSSKGKERCQDEDSDFDDRSSDHDSDCDLESSEYSSLGSIVQTVRIDLYEAESFDTEELFPEEREDNQAPEKLTKLVRPVVCLVEVEQATSAPITRNLPPSSQQGQGSQEVRQEDIRKVCIEGTEKGVLERLLLQTELKPISFPLYNNLF
uniref:Uncharacterized protein n=1 Tax=Nelumbo nucifera TaxID=4432 RepID=A0A822ZEQ6_NELNU|nr:TPA_asm: hypothetical protein HUJ06_001597 [Nelumbo nucifera]